MVYTNADIVPSDAILVTENEAIEAQLRIIHAWRPQTDVWALLFGPFGGAMVCGVSGFYINSYYRRKLKLGRFGHTTSYLPMVFLPTIFTGLFHYQSVTANIIIKKDKCEICTEMKAQAIQCIFGIGYPLILGPTINYFLASVYNTYRVPVINKNPKLMWEFHKDISRYMYKNRSLVYLLAANLLTTSILTYYEFKNFYSLEAKLEKIEKDFIAKGIIFS